MERYHSLLISLMRPGDLFLEALFDRNYESCSALIKKYPDLYHILLDERETLKEVISKDDVELFDYYTSIFNGRLADSDDYHLARSAHSNSCSILLHILKTSKKMHLDLNNAFGAAMRKKSTEAAKLLLYYSGYNSDGIALHSFGSLEKLRLVEPSMVEFYYSQIPEESDHPIKKVLEQALSFSTKEK